MKSFILAAAIAVASAFESEETLKFTNWMANFGKEYGSAQEFEYRMEQWLRREEAIVKHNAGEHSFTMGHNSRSDLSEFEFRHILTYTSVPQENREYEEESNGFGGYQTVDWRQLGAVNSI